MREDCGHGSPGPTRLFHLANEIGRQTSEEFCSLKHDAAANMHATFSAVASSGHHFFDIYLWRENKVTPAEAIDGRILYRSFCRATSFAEGCD